MANAQDSISSQGIVKYLGDNLFAIPGYQRAYSWKTPTSEKDGSIQNRYQVKEFWDDITNAYRNNNNQSSKKNYYIGTIVTSDSTSSDMSTNGREESRQNVVDGQQRMVTLYLLYVALADWCKSQGEECEELYKDSLKKVFDVPSGRWAKAISQAKRRLTLPDADGVNLDLLLDKILEDTPIDVDDLSQNNTSNIIEAFIFFRESIQKLSEDSDLLNNVSGIDHPIDLIGNFNDYMREYLYAGVVKTEDEIRAHVVFETLNDRGMPLGAEDLIKNYLFSRAGNKYNDVTHKWKEIAQNLAKIKSGDKLDSLNFELSAFDKFIQRYMNSYSNPDKSSRAKSKAWVPDSRIFTCFKQWFAEKENGVKAVSSGSERMVTSVMDELLHASEIYTSLHREEYWKNNIFKRKEIVGESVPLISFLENINGMDLKDWYSPLYPLFFSALLHIEKKMGAVDGNSKQYKKVIKELDTFIHYIESYIFRHYILLYKPKRASAGHEIKPVGRFIRSDKFAHLAQKIRDGEYENLSDIFDEDIFDNCFSDNMEKKFRDKLSVIYIENTGRTPEEQPFVQFVKYILRKIENIHQEENGSEMRVANYGPAASLEHIFPYKFFKNKDFDGWEEFYDKGQKKYNIEYIFRLGNYTLLHKELNGKASAKPWPEKKEHFEESKISHTAEIVKYDIWSPDVVDEVQGDLADKIIKVWDNPRHK